MHVFEIWLHNFNDSCHVHPAKDQCHDARQVVLRQEAKEIARLIKAVFIENE
jgi:hypothetical protein